MFENFEETCRYLEFPEEAVTELGFQYGKIKCDSAASDYMAKIYEEYTNDKLSVSLYEGQTAFEKMCQEIDVHSYQSQMIYYICLVPALFDKYMKKGIPEKIFKTSMADLRCKLFECYCLYGIWGSFVAVWFSRFFNFTLYGIGRLEFALFNCDYDHTSPEGYTVKKGDPVIDVHIPSRGRLPHGEVIESYKEAYCFWRDHLGIDPKGFVCESWMLFPEHESIIPDAENLMAFYRDYDIKHSGYDDGSGDLWRIFYVYVNKDCLDLLPRKTYLQRRYAEHLEKGGKSGWGMGIIPIKRIICE